MKKLFLFATLTVLISCKSQSEEQVTAEDTIFTIAVPNIDSIVSADLAAISDSLIIKK